MPPLPLVDIVALAFFLCAWAGYHFYVERVSPRRRGLNAMMNLYRISWMEQMSRREVRIVDTAVTASLQNGTAFFASTSLIAIGAAATLLRGTDDVLRVFSDLPFGLTTARWLWEVKVLGLGAIFGYSFFKFAWSYRLYNYSAILIGATPPANSPHVEERQRALMRAARMNIAAARHFTRGQRAFFFSFAYLGWFVSPYVFLITTAGTLYVIWSRQFASDARDALVREERHAASVALEKNGRL
ncbi:MAG: DUF599 family protein [Methylobacteriaceae bacterium]|nr:DUF599 family protein [Methylobacteriaceae bacterium]